MCCISTIYVLCLGLSSGIEEGRSKDEDVVPLPSLISEVELKASHGGSPSRCSRGEAQDGAERRSGLGLADGEEPWFAAVMRENSAEAVTHAKSPREGGALPAMGACDKAGTVPNVVHRLTCSSL